jgi:hypothetical protein
MKKIKSALLASLLILVSCVGQKKPAGVTVEIPHNGYIYM